MGILPQQGFDNIPSMFDDVFHDTPVAYCRAA
jgi:hypothetical protein